MAHIEYFREHGEWSPQDLRYGTPESMDELLRHTRTINRMAPGDVQFWEERRREQDERLRARQFELNAEPGINIPSWSPPVGPQNIPYRPPTGPRGLLAGLRMKAPTESGILGLTDFSDDYMSTRPADMPEMLSYTPSQRTGYPGVSQDYDDFSPVMGMLTDMAGDQPVYDEAVVTDMPSRSVFNRSQFTSDMPDVSQTLPEDTLRSMLDSRQPRAWGPVPSDGIVSIGTRQEEAASPDVIPEDANPAVTGQHGLTQDYNIDFLGKKGGWGNEVGYTGQFSPMMGTLSDMIGDQPDTTPTGKVFGPLDNPVPRYSKASTSSGFMPPGSGLTVAPNLSGSVYVGLENPNTAEMRSLDQQADVMTAFRDRKPGMTIEEFNLGYPSYTPGTGPSTVLGKQYHPGSFDTGTSGVVQHPQDFMTTTPTSSPADILAAAQVDTFRPVEQLRSTGPSALTPGGVPVDDALPDPRFKSSIFDYLPSFISTASASDVVPTDFETYLADESWHGSNFGQVKTNVASKDFSNWASEQLRKADEVPVLPDFNTTMFDDIFTNQVPDPFATMEVKRAIVDDSFIGRMFADEEAAKNVETFVDIPAQPAPVVQTRRTTPTPVATPAITESDEMAMMVRDAVNRMAIRDQVRQDLLANRDRGGVSHAEVQAAINAMMGNEFGGMLGVGGLGRTMEDVGYGGGFASGRGDTGATGQGGWT